MPKLESAGVSIIAISYDSPKILRQFSSKHEIAFPLLSDEDSATIRAWGVLNEEATGKTAGIPHPGTFLIDESGVVRAKLFFEGYMKRHDADAILAAAAALDSAS